MDARVWQRQATDCYHKFDFDIKLKYTLKDKNGLSEQILCDFFSFAQITLGNKDV